MAELTMKTKGRRGINWHVAREVEVQAELATQTTSGAGRATRILGAHTAEGHSYIDTDRGNVDHYVILNDERGQSAAMSIEYGREPDAEGKGGMEGVAPLRKAFGIDT